MLTKHNHRRGLPLFLLPSSSSKHVKSECGPRDTGGIRQDSEDAAGMEDFESWVGGIIEPRRSLFVAGGHSGKADPPFQFSLDSSEILDDDAFFADCKTRVFVSIPDVTMHPGLARKIH